MTNKRVYYVFGNPFLTPNAIENTMLQPALCPMQEQELPQFSSSCLSSELDHDEKFEPWPGSKQRSEIQIRTKRSLPPVLDSIMKDAYGDFSEGGKSVSEPSSDCLELHETMIEADAQKILEQWIHMDLLVE